MESLAENIRLFKPVQITQGEFNLLRDLIYRQSGINLSLAKMPLVINRLQKLLKKNGFKSFHQYYEFLTHDPQPEAISELINQISTNHTFFYRESDHFDFLVKTALPARLDQLTRDKSRDLSIWCAAASSGEEPYTLAMLVREFLGGNRGLWDTGILATDISAKVLDKARRGVYESEAVGKLPKVLRQKYFKKISPAQCEVIPEIKKDLTYRRFNLLNSFPFKKHFDIIFIRNVMIYFDEPTKNQLFKKLYAITKPGGYVFLGHAETMGRTGHSFTFLKPAVYRRLVE